MSLQAHPVIPDAIAEHAPAKVNLALHVTGRRADGYHLLETLVVFVEAGDVVTVRPSDRDTLTVGGRYAEQLAGDDGNLVARARDLLRGLAPDRPTSAVSIDLRKSLPVASGIGGGSSDAAATLRALCRLWGLDIPKDRLRGKALALGADLPMCLEAHPLIASGIGETLVPVAAMPQLPMVLVNPGVAVPTRDIFKALRRLENPPLPRLPEPLDQRGLLDWIAETRNDLQPPAMMAAPAIGDAIAALTNAGAAFARMSGSGATCFGIFASQDEATAAAATISAAQRSWYVEATRTIEQERNHGAD